MYVFIIRIECKLNSDEAACKVVCITKTFLPTLDDIAQFQNMYADISITRAKNNARRTSTKSSHCITISVYKTGSKCDIKSMIPIQ